MPDKKSYIYQTSAGQAISSDGNFLVETVLGYHPQKYLKVLDIGCGCGILGFMLKLKRPSWQIYGLDIQANLIQLAKKNSQICKLEVKFIHQDLNQHKEKYDLIICNPPFYPANSGKMPKNLGKQLARFELKCTQEEIIAAAGRCLHTKGSSYILYPLSRLKSQELQAKIIANKGSVGVIRVKSETHPLCN